MNNVIESSPRQPGAIQPCAGSHAAGRGNTSFTCELGEALSGGP